MKIQIKLRQGFTLVELLVVLVILASMVAIAAPYGRGMLQRSKALHCNQNLRQIGAACMLYASEHNMRLPETTHQRSKGGKSWSLTLQPYSGDRLTFKCAQDPIKARSYTYLINDFLTPNPSGAPFLNYSILANIDRPGSTFLFAEAAPGYRNADHFHFSPYYGGRVPAEVFEYQVASGAHGDKANYLFADGHVQIRSQREVRALLRSAQSGFVDPTPR